MSETARRLVQDAMIEAQVLALGETVDPDQEAYAFRSLKYMLRNWTQDNIRIPYSTRETITLDGSASYTWGSGGDITTTRPEALLGGYIADTLILKIIDEDKYRRLVAQSFSGTTEFLWYHPSYPLGILYPYPLGADTIIVDTLKELSDPSAITSSVTFPTGYDDAIKWNLAVRLCPGNGKEPSPTTQALAISTLSAIEDRNFFNQISAANLEILRLAHNRYNIDKE